MPRYRMLRDRILIGLLVAANVGFAAVWAVRHYLLRETPPALTVAQSHELPILRLQDDKGKVISTSRFIGAPLFVQAVNPYIEAQINSLIRIRAKRPKHKMSWLVITKDAMELRKRLTDRSDDLVIVEDNSNMLRDLFSIPRCCEGWLIFDQAGKLRGDGRYDEGNAKDLLYNVVDGKQLYSPAILLEILKVLNTQGALEQMHNAAKNSHEGKAVIVMLSSVCTGCDDALLVDMLNSYARQNRSVGYLALLPNTFSRIEVENLKTNLDITFPVAIAATALSEKWSSLNEQYGARTINGTVILVDGGNVISIASGFQETKGLLAAAGS